MSLPPFGAFRPLCRSVPSYPICNLFTRQLFTDFPNVLASYNFNRDVSGVGVNPQCAIPQATAGAGAGQNGGGGSGLGNIANVIACGLSIVFVIFLIAKCSRRKAAVGRVELRAFLILYLLTLPFQLLDTGALIKQATTQLSILTAVHMGLIAATFWMLLGNAIVATQIVEDGTMSSLVPFYAFSLFFFVATTYISLDTAFTFTNAFRLGTGGAAGSNVQDLTNIPLFALTSIWPAAATFFYFLIMTYVVLGILREMRPFLYYCGAAFLFVLSQLGYFLLSKIVCRATSAKLDMSFGATVLETASVGMLYLAWRSITEESWDEPW
ncbi:Chitin synthase export chaperone [Ceratobasidium theobromae]|uniref:Chitin synthase export chaperone n=1 Tax=Ceratobasidium theobromae TaxID=1582974 RepID=A0A5N5QAC8_9AGAM|nr:Chitin synthase export chaperone [Ceratobasidium theobromae]